jgi:hypothetical protein
MFHKHPRNDPTSAQVEITLADHINNVKAGLPKKLSFEEWWTQTVHLLPGYLYPTIKLVWEAAQRNA